MKNWYQNKYFWTYSILLCAIILFIGSLVFKSSLNNGSFDYKFKQFQNNIYLQEKDAAALIADTALIKRLTSGKETEADLNYLYNKPYYFFVYRKANHAEYLWFWNTAVTVIPDSVLSKLKDEQLVRLANGYYYIKKHYVDPTGKFNIYTAILIKSKFFINTGDFKESFSLYPGMNGLASLSSRETPYEVKSMAGKALFYLNKKAGLKEGGGFWLSVMRLTSFFLIFLSLYLLLYKKVVEKFNFLDIPLFIACMLAFRISLYVCKELFALDALELFRPGLYNLNSSLPSLGDLLLNSLFFCWFGIFIWNRTKPAGPVNSTKKTKVNWLKGLLSVALLLVLTFVTINVIRSIVANSNISFDVTNFFSLSIYTAIGFVILAFLSFGFHYFSKIIYLHLFPAFAGRVYLVYLLIAVGGLCYIAFISPYATGLYLVCLVWLLLYTLLFSNEKSLNKLIEFNISATVIWIFIFSISISVLMLSEITKAELSQRRHYLEKLNTQSDPATERLIVMATTYLDNDFFRDNFRRLYDARQNKYLRDSILSTNYSRYIRDYSASLYFFDSTHQPLFNQGNLSYEAVNNIVLRQSTPTRVRDLYFYEPSYGQFAYLTYRKVVSDSGSLLGTVCIISRPKKFSPVIINSELFRQYKDWEFLNSPVYYAIYSNKLLQESSKKYPFTSTLEQSEVPKSLFELRERNGYSELWYRPTNNKVIVMTRKNEMVLETITLFSYIFCAFLFLVALIQVVSSVLKFALSKGKTGGKLQFSTSIRGQIHNTFILITLLSFIIIGIATISFFTKRFEESNADHLGRTMNIMLNELQSHREIGALVYEQTDSLKSRELENILKRVADIHGVDVNFYNFKGTLLTSSQPEIYQKGILSMKIDPRAYYYLLRLRHIEHTQKEKVSGLKYTNMYAPLRNEDGSFYAYLSIPYFTSERVLNEEISRFLVTLINLNAFIFLITGLVALLIANRITHSFALIRSRLMEVNLSAKNEAIEWNRNDEIGSLVTEYNKMVNKLRVSADALAKSERQEAWREMARQVAHEIKNPLTPMKLSLQYLQKAIDNNSPNIQQLTFNVSKTLVEQIDHLSKIASDFSQFANINHVQTEIFDLHEVIQPLIVLYGKNPEAKLQWHPLAQPLYIFADKTHINRVFTNLFGNAIEAARPEVPCKITIKERIEDKKIFVSVKDNGVGISEDMHNKIFIPNFTTKSSGTGLGLAMCKTIIEQAGGEITFETEVNKGTTFFIMLPLID